MPVSTEVSAGPPVVNSGETTGDGKQEVHDVFKFSAKLHFAEAICKIEPIPMNRVQLLLDSCPIPSEETLKIDKSDYYHAVSLLLVRFSFLLLYSTHMNLVTIIIFIIASNLI